jgi:hypothetical protein
VAPMVRQVGTRASWWSSRMEQRHRSTRPTFKGTRRHCVRSVCGIDVPNALRQVGPGGNEEADRWAALQWFSNSKITAGIELSGEK